MNDTNEETCTSKQQVSPRVTDIPEGSMADSGFTLGLGPLKFPGKCLTVEAASDPQRELRDEAGKVDGGYLRNICLLSDGLRIYLIGNREPLKV